jgi:hypothetical protein
VRGTFCSSAAHRAPHSTTGADVTVSTTAPLARTDIPAPAPSAGGAARRGSRPLAALTVAAPLLLAASIALHPDDTHGVEHTLTAVAGDERLRWALIHLLEPAAWLLLGLTLLLTLPRMAAGRGRRLLTTAGVFSAVGFSSLALLVYAHGEAFLFMAATDVEPSTYGPLFEQFETGFPLAALPSTFGRLGLLLAAIGLVRARSVPVWAAVLLLLPIALLGSGGSFPLPVGLALTIAPLVVCLAFCARRVATTGGPALPAGR